MRTTFKAIALAISGISITSLALAQGPNIDYDKIQIISQQLAPNFYTFTGSPNLDPGHPEAAGGRIGVLVGSEGVLLVDATYLPLSDKVADAIKEVNPGPVRFLVDTHYHPDHTGGNPSFVKTGALLFAREEVRDALMQPLPPATLAVIGKAASFTDPARLPTVTYGPGSPVKIYFDGDTIDLIPLRAAHTDGDTMVRFEKADIIMVGDFYRNYGYPFIDVTRGGSFKGVLEAVDVLLQNAGPNTKLLPGHGTVTTRSDVEAYRDMILDVQSRILQMIREGKSIQEVLAAKLTVRYDSKVPGGATPLPIGVGTSADRFVSSLYTELKSGK
ncbi:glyoxylase-like metal-dependent hydrolase (beta-lactamase superfamily II) [Silvibacterium bohemicum]|uniref:Glyoxylase-like metal-dependent hydrolase (Beta-lactamase superfamily II) n=1 Tax=Silvibacterium bohemicum TaxID=1577686 RepID=A0A841JWM6_9BACT|nr:MBL fold metallo-hydrolase [Silvibacterium bohemicum]MBB6144119.1 glyoxylase-like metal-dependent hydrolase (beta-lactamase superfamily II) [Silvibacterium bohemicum]